jgi:rubrerythrin
MLMSERPSLALSDGGILTSPRTRREMLKLMAAGGVAVLLPSMLGACSDDDGAGVTGPGTGDALTIDFARGDIAILQFAYALEQLEADFYTRVVSGMSGTGLSQAEQAIMVDLRNHEVLHRELFKAALGPSNDFTITTTYPGVNFTSRQSILEAARTFEDLGVAAYNGAAQYIGNADTLTLAGKIVSVEARHASAIRDLLAPNSDDFAPNAFDDVFRPALVGQAAQGFITESLTLANAPATFVQGPNNNG